MNADFDDAKERVRQATDLVDLIGGYLEMRRQGTNYVARCPWHDDRKPSLTVNPQRQSWKCWVCNVGGDAFSFVMKKENIDFREALEMLAQRANIELRPTQGPKAEPGSPHDKKTLYAAMTHIERVFRECLREADIAAPAREYLAERGLNADSLERFGIGFSPNEWTWLLDRTRHTQFSADVLDACGMVSHGTQSGKQFDRFRGRIMFPIRDPQGRTVAFGGRVLPQWADTLPGKYINSPETRLFSKSDHLYALDIARESIAKSRNITVVEGYTDVMMAHQFGATDVVAVLGTALGARHIRNLRRFADRITLVLDGDAAGQRRTNEILELFVQAQVDLRVLTLPEEYDPCEFFLERGAEAWQTLLATAVDALEHKIRIATAGIDLVHDLHRSTQALEDVLSVLAHAPQDQLSASDANPLRLQQTLTRLAHEFRVSEESVRNRWRELRRKQAAKPLAAETRSDEPNVPRSRSVPEPHVVWTAASLDPRERELLEILAQHCALALTVLEELSADDLPSYAAREILTAIRRLEESGRDLEFSAILAALEEERLKNLWVEIDERAARKEEKALQDAPTRLRSVIDSLHSHEHDRLHRESLAVLEESRLETDDEKIVLLQMLERQRRRQGFPEN